LNPTLSNKVDYEQWVGICFTRSLSFEKSDRGGKQEYPILSSIAK
jgi:hypothetical protein